MKINRMDITVNLFAGENKVKKWVADDRSRANLTLFTNVSKKKGNEYENLFVPVTIWADVAVVERMEGKIWAELNRVGQSKPISITVMGGSLDGRIMEMVDTNGNQRNVTTPTISVNLSPYQTILINGEFESPYFNAQETNQAPAYVEQPQPQQPQQQMMYASQPQPQQGQFQQQPMQQPQQPQDINLEEIKF